MGLMSWTEHVRRRLKLKDLDVLLSVVELGGIGKAAGKLHISQPAVSKAIAGLERQLGVQLLDRSPRGTEPTAYARALIRRIVTVFDELGRGMEDIQFLNDPTVGEVRIGAPEPIAAAIIAPVVDKMSRQFKQISFRVTAGDTEALLRQMSDRKLEFVVSRVPGPPAENISFDVLFSDPLVVAADKGHPLMRRRKLALADLVGEPWTLQPEDSFFGSMVAAAFRASGLTPRLSVPTNSFNLRRELLATGRFLTVVPRFSLLLPCKHPTLRALPVSFAVAPHKVAILSIKGRSLTPLSQSFIDEVRLIRLANE